MTKTLKILFVFIAFIGVNVSNEPSLFADDVIKEKKIVILGVGDINLGGSALEVLDKEGFDFAFNSTRHIIKSADVAIGNLEAPVTDQGTPHPTKAYVYRKPHAALKAIANAGFDILCLANNHIMDYGKEGLFDTIKNLDKMRLMHAGAGENLKRARIPAIFNVKGVSVGYLAYSLTFPKDFWADQNKAGTVFGHEKYVRADVADLAKKVNVVVVGFHWGSEKQPYPKPYQIMLAHAAIEAGADIIFGHHPHILESVEWYKKGIIFYSLGNFAFGSYSENAKTGAIATVKVLSNGSIQEVKIVPLYTYNVEVLFNPKPLLGKKAEAVMSELKEISSDFNSKFIMNGNLIQVLRK